MSRDPYALQALALCGAVAHTDRVLVISADAAAHGALLPQFEARVTVCASAPDAPGSPFDVVVVDLDSLKSAEPVAGALQHVKASGALIVLDRSRSWARALRNAPWSLGLTGRSTYAPQSLERLVKGHGLSDLAAYFVEPHVNRPRHIVDRAFRSEIPGLSSVGWKRWLLHQGGFYLQPRHTVILARSPQRATPIEDAVGAVRATGALGSVEGSFRIRQRFVSGTNVLMFKVAGPLESRGADVFVRFPLSGTAERRAAHHHEMLVRLDSLGYALAPRPMGAGVANGFQYFAEEAKHGTTVSRALHTMKESAFLARFDAALEALEALHLLRGRRQTLDEPAFDQHIGARIELLRACLLSQGCDDGVCSALATYMRREYLGKEMLVGLCHGDAKLANCLFQSSSLTGVIDWDMSDHEGLCFADVAALAASSLLQRTGKSVTDLLSDAVHRHALLVESLGRHHARTRTTPVGFTSTLALYWLDRVARHQSLERVTDEWFARYVQPVANGLERRLTDGSGSSPAK